MSDRENRIREIAYFIWQEEGRPDGQAERHWRSAQAIVESLEADQKSGEGEAPGEAPAECLTPLATLARGPSSAGAR